MNNSVPVGDVTPGLLGFFVVVALGVALYLLIKSMNKQISKIEVPHENEPEQAERDSTAGRTR